MSEKLKPEKKKLQRWGNSCGIRLPRIFLDEIALQEGDEVVISIEDNVLLIAPAKAKQKKTTSWKLNRAIELLTDIQKNISSK